LNHTVFLAIIKKNTEQPGTVVEAQLSQLPYLSAGVVALVHFMSISITILNNRRRPITSMEPPAILALIAPYEEQMFNPAFGRIESGHIFRIAAE
jgi:hypothetical protein